MFRVCVVPTNAGEEAVLRSARMHHLPTAGMAREGDYPAAFAARHGLYQILDYDTPDGTRASCRAAVARECSHVLVVDNPACRLAAGAGPRGRGGREPGRAARVPPRRRDDRVLPRAAGVAAGLAARHVPAVARRVDGASPRARAAPRRAAQGAAAAARRGTEQS